MLMNGLSRYRDFGLLLLRVGIGASMIVHGYGKVLGGPREWTRRGASMNSVGIDFLPQFWGFMAGFAETGGGFLLALGFLFRPTLILLLIPTMIVATAVHIRAGDSFSRISHPAELLVVFLALIFIGPGRFSVDEGLLGKSRRKK